MSGNNPSVKDELRKALAGVWNDEEFIEAVLAFSQTDDERAKVLDYINGEKDVTSTDVLLMATFTDMDRNDR